MKSLPLLLATIGLALATIALLEAQHTAQNDALPLIHADFQVCATVQPPPLEQRRGVPLNPRQSELS